MSTVSNHQTATPFAGPVANTTNRAADVLANDNALATATNAHDADATIHVQSSDTASRPAAGVAGRLWFTTDDQRWWHDTGSAWEAIAYLPTTGGTVSGNLTVAGDVLVTAGALKGTGASGATLVSLSATGDTVNRFAVTVGAQTTIALGPGGVSPTDVTISRDAPATIRVGNTLIVGASDPGGAETLRVNGGARITGALQILGVPNFAGGTTGTATTGASGALPAQPDGYFSVQAGGSNKRIPYYNP